MCVDKPSPHIHTLAVIAPTTTLLTQQRLQAGADFSTILFTSERERERETANQHMMSINQVTTKKSTQIACMLSCVDLHVQP